MILIERLFLEKNNLKVDSTKNIGLMFSNCVTVKFTKNKKSKVENGK